MLIKLIVTDYLQPTRCCCCCRRRYYYQLQQEAQLSQRDRATLRVIEYFPKSLKVIRNDTVEKGVCKSLLVFH